MFRLIQRMEWVWASMATATGEGCGSKALFAQSRQKN